MANKAIAGKIKNRRDTAANWTTKNPVLLAGEIGYENDTGFIKAGDGTTAWTSLEYIKMPSNVAVSFCTDETNDVWIDTPMETVEFVTAGTTPTADACIELTEE